MAEIAWTQTGASAGDDGDPGALRREDHGSNTRDAGAPSSGRQAGARYAGTPKDGGSNQEAEKRSGRGSLTSAAPPANVKRPIDQDSGTQEPHQDYGGEEGGAKDGNNATRNCDNWRKGRAGQLQRN